MLSIRTRVALSVFAVMLALLASMTLVVLERVERGFRAVVDEALERELVEVWAVVGTPALQSLIDAEAASEEEPDEIFIEVLDTDGRTVATSFNCPPAGLPAAPGSDRGASERFYEAPNPASAGGKRLVRLVEAQQGAYRVRVAASLDLAETRTRSLRIQLTYALIGIAALGAGAAYWVAARSLRPVRRITARAGELQGLASGELPRTGSGDEIDQLAGVLNDLLRRARAEISRMSRLIADAGHALRTPLTAIRGHLELQAAVASGRDLEALEAPLEELDRLIRLVNDLLLLERLESRLSDAQSRRTIDLAPLSREIVEHMRILAIDRDIQLECKTESARVRAEPNQIRQALVNLLDNALRLTPRGGKVQVDVGPREGRACLAVSDTGPGLAADELERVFERFYSGSGSEGTGVGLGLPIARAIARTHGGDLRAFSGVGARFEIELPLAETP